ncbi:hypothetical protein Misp06_03679 [Microbulbifer sp. NBRC 101763]
MDILLTTGSMLIEFGLLTLLAYLIVTKPTKRSLVAPVLGAVTPMVLFLIIGVIDHYIFPSEEPSMFLASFAMGLFLYCILAGIGFLLGLFLPKAVGLRWRYIIAFFLGPTIGWGLITAW